MRKAATVPAIQITHEAQANGTKRAHSLPCIPLQFFSAYSKERQSSMRKFALVLFCSAFFFTGSAFASCSMSQSYNGLVYVYSMNEDLSTSTQGPCYTFDSGTAWQSSITDCIFSAGAWKFTGIGQNILSGAFTVGNSDSGSTTFGLNFEPELVSPNHSFYDNLTASVSVVHNGVITK